MQRRTAGGRRSRTAIIAAARDLLSERGGPSFTVDELAVRADVARRTVFNHFASLDQVVLEVCADEIVELVDRVTVAAERSSAERDRGELFEYLVAIIEDTDVAGATARITAALGGAEHVLSDPRLHALVQAAFGRVSERIVAAFDTRAESAATLDIEILISAVMGGLVAIALRWIADTGAVITPDSRRVWNSYLAALVGNLRDGFAPGAGAGLDRVKALRGPAAPS